MESLLEENSSVIREAAGSLCEFSKNPHNLSLWVKLETRRFTVDSSNSHVLKVWGEPKKLPIDKGLHFNWGALFNYGDMLEILDYDQSIQIHWKGEVKPFHISQTDWSISVWFVVPFLKSPDFKVLLQNSQGFGAYVCICNKGKWIGAFDETTGMFCRAIKIRRLKRGWHNLIVTSKNEYGKE